MLDAEEIATETQGKRAGSVSDGLYAVAYASGSFLALSFCVLCSFFSVSSVSSVALWFVRNFPRSAQTCRSVWVCRPGMLGAGVDRD